MGRPPKSGRSPQELIELRESPQGIWSYLSPSELQRHKHRTFHPDDFHVAISDDNGHDVKKQTRWHPMMMNELAMIVARGNFPVDNVDDLIRSAVFWFMGVLYALEKKSPAGVPNPLPMLAVMNRNSMAVYYENLFDSTIDRIRENVRAMAKKGRERQAAIYVYDQIEQIKLIPQRAYRQPALEQINEEFGALLRKNMKTVKVLQGKKSKGRAGGGRNYIGGGEEGE